jgi:hypothetical protein
LIDLDQGGEIAMKFGFDENGEVQIEGYSAHRNNEGFSADELRTLYLLASKDNEALHKDEPAAQLLQEYVSQFSLEQGFNSPPTCEVYSLESLSPEQLPGVKRSKKDKKKQARRKGRYHESSTTKECFRCTVHGFDNSDHGDPVPDREIPVLDVSLARNTSRLL